MVRFIGRILGIANWNLRIPILRILLLGFQFWKHNVFIGLLCGSARVMLVLLLMGMSLLSTSWFETLMSQCRIHRVQEENHHPMIGVVQVMFFIAKHPFLSITLLLTTFPETSECTVVGMDTSCVSIYFRKIRETSLSHLTESFYGEFFSSFSWRKPPSFCPCVINKLQTSCWPSPATTRGIA